MGLGGGQDKDDMGRWFLKGFEQGIGGTAAQHMDLVYYIDLIAGLIGGVIDLLAQLPDIVNTGITGGVYLYDIQCPAFIYCQTHLAGVARLTLIVVQAVDSFGKYTGSAGLTRSPGAAEKIGMRCAFAFQGIAQRLSHRFLADNLSKSFWSPFPIKDLAHLRDYYTL
jgi:hypothetical protein